jgi:ketosteroid isomerase-like protein
MDDTELRALVAVAHAHADAEGRGDIEATMATLDDDPVYELQPIGRTLRGREAARAYYENFFSNCRPHIRDYELRSEFVSDEGVLQEYILEIAAPDGSVNRHSIIGLLTFGASGKLSGERIYAGDDLIKFMFGSVLEDD